jgi:hypothetical protein
VFFYPPALYCAWQDRKQMPFAWRSFLIGLALEVSLVSAWLIPYAQRSSAAALGQRLTEEILSRTPVGNSALVLLSGACLFGNPIPDLPPLHPAHGKGIEESLPEPIMDAVLCGSLEPWSVSDRHFDDLPALHTHYGGQESVQALKRWESGYTLSPKGPDRASHVSNLVTGKPVSETVADTGGKLTLPIIMPQHAHAVYHVSLVGENPLDHGRQISRVVLPIAIHSSQDLSPSRAPASQHSGGLAMVPLKGHIRVMWVSGMEATKLWQGIILGTIVNPHTLPAPAMRRKRTTDL